MSPPQPESETANRRRGVQVGATPASGSAPGPEVRRGPDSTAESRGVELSTEAGAIGETASDLAGPELAASELAASELAASDLAGPDLVASTKDEGNERGAPEDTNAVRGGMEQSESVHTDLATTTPSAAEANRESSTLSWYASLLRLARIAFGSLLLLAGIIMLVLPGPGLLFILLGLGLIDLPLSHRIQDWLRSRFAGVMERFKR